ncbi:LOW QUALITY PROTEIN: lipoprotein lpqo, partial [Mycobacterium tuberculosis EAS054]
DQATRRPYGRAAGGGRAGTDRMRGQRRQGRTRRRRGPGRILGHHQRCGLEAGGRHSRPNRQAERWQRLQNRVCALGSERADQGGDRRPRAVTRVVGRVRPHPRRADHADGRSGGHRRRAGLGDRRRAGRRPAADRAAQAPARAVAADLVGPTSPATATPPTWPRAVRSALDATDTPPPAPATSGQTSLDLDTAAIDEALGRSGTIAGGVYKFFIARRDPVTMSGMLIPPSMGLATALNFQPTGNGRAAINGDFVMTAAEVQDVVQALRGGGIDIVAIHNHGFDEQPRLFYMHFWAENDAVALARTLRAAVDATAAR